MKRNFKSPYPLCYLARVKDNIKIIKSPLKIWIINLKLGIKQAYSIPDLPGSIERYYNHPITRILRVIGGIVALAVLFKKHLLFPYPINIILPIIALLQFTQMFYIYMTKLIYGIYYIIKHPESIEVRYNKKD